MKLQFILQSLCVIAVLSCGQDNIFEPYAKEKTIPAEEKEQSLAIEAINNEDWDQAEEKLTAILAEDPENTQVKVMLSNVFLKKTGLDTLEFSKSVDEATDTSGSLDVPVLIQKLPEGNSNNVDTLKQSVDTFNSIPTEELNPTQKFQKAMAEFSYSMVLTKQTAVDEKGKYDESKASSLLTESNAETIITNMDAAAATITSIGGEENLKGADKITSTTDSIKSQEGEDSASKLKAFLIDESNK